MFSFAFLWPKDEVSTQITDFTFRSVEVTEETCISRSAVVINTTTSPQILFTVLRFLGLVDQFNIIWSFHCRFICTAGNLPHSTNDDQILTVVVLSQSWSTMPPYVVKWWTSSCCSCSLLVRRNSFTKE